jgi:hypothetical protein
VNGCALALIGSVADPREPAHGALVEACGPMPASRGDEGAGTEATVRGRGVHKGVAKPGPRGPGFFIRC